MASPRFHGYNLWQAALLISCESLSVSLWLFQSTHPAGQIFGFSLFAMALLFAFAVDSTGVCTLLGTINWAAFVSWRRAALACAVLIFSPLLFALYCFIVWYNVARPFFAQPKTYRRVGMCIVAFALPIFLLGTPMSFAAAASSAPTGTAKAAIVTTDQQATSTVDPAVATATGVAFIATETAYASAVNATATAISQPTPTSIPPTPTPLPTVASATGNPPQVGGTLADFIAQYGQPTHPTASTTIFYTDSAQTEFIGVDLNNGIVIRVSFSGDSSWDDVQTYNACAQYLPSDAVLFNNDSNQYYDYHSSLGEIVLMNLGQGQCSVYEATA